MFPRPESRIRTTLRRSIDAAIDFATLGEYGLASAWEDPADGIPAAAGSGTATRARQDQRLTVRVGAPASAAGRAARNHDRRDAGACAGQHLLSRALEPQLPRAARSRDGQAPREQRCASDAG
jgi:hypothetical protein